MAALRKAADQDQPAIGAERETTHRSIVAQSAPNPYSGRVDELDRTNPAGGGQRGAIRAERQTLDPVINLYGIAPALARDQVPEHRVIGRTGRAGGQQPAVGTESQAPHDRPSGERIADHGPGFDIPELDRSAVIAGGQYRAVGAEGQGRHPVDVRQERRHRSARRGVEDLAYAARAAAYCETAVVARGRKPAAIGAECGQHDQRPAVQDRPSDWLARTGLDEAGRRAAVKQNSGAVGAEYGGAKDGARTRRRCAVSSLVAALGPLELLSQIIPADLPENRDVVGTDREDEPAVGRERRLVYGPFVPKGCADLSACGDIEDPSGGTANRHQ